MAGKRRVVLARFPGGGIMPYLTDEDIRTGEKAAIETNKGKLVVVEVIKTEEIPRKMKKKASKWIIQKIDMTNYKRRSLVG